MKFEEYLQQKHAERYRGYDDGMEDSYEKWVCDIGIDEIIKFAEEWKAFKQFRNTLVDKYLMKGNHNE